MKKLTEQERSEFLGAFMLWCFKWGCEVELRNRAQNVPVMERLSPYAMGENHEIQADGSIVDMAHRTNHKVIEFPELIFRRGNRQCSVVGHTWDDLLRRLEFTHTKIYMDLSVPMLQFPNRNLTPTG